MQYARFKNSGFVIFPDNFPKSKISSLSEEKVVSSGFVSIDCDGNVFCYSNSGYIKGRVMDKDSELFKAQLISGESIGR